VRIWHRVLAWASAYWPTADFPCRGLPKQNGVPADSCRTLIGNWVCGRRHEENCWT
jgi:hypothetical protein